jgi:hypothetical protein
LQLALPLLAAGSFFLFRGEAADLNDPSLPFFFRLGKDLVFLFLVFPPLYFAVLHRGLALPVTPTIYWLLPLWLAALMLLIGSWKADLSFTPAGLVRNIGFYYAGGAAIAALGWRFNYQLRLFRVFRLLMAFSVGLGLYFYLARENLLLYTIHFRMIGTLGNPNFLGFLVVLWIAVLHGEVAYVGRLKPLHVVELGVALIGLAAAASVAAVLSYGAWIMIVVLAMAVGWLPKISSVRRLFAYELLIGMALVLVGMLLVAGMSDVMQLLVRLQGLGTSETLSVRLADYQRLFLDFAHPGSLLMGQSDAPSYVQFDGSNPSILYNFGLVFFLLWTGYFLFPVVITARFRRALLRRGAASDQLALFLAPALFVAFAVEYWLQYIPEMYPPCVILGWMMFFLVINAHDVNRLAKARE